MKDLKVTDEELLLLMDAVNLLESACFYTHSEIWKLKKLGDIRNRIKVTYDK